MAAGDDKPKEPIRPRRPPNPESEQWRPANPEQEQAGETRIPGEDGSVRRPSQADQIPTRVRPPQKPDPRSQARNIRERKATTPSRQRQVVEPDNLGELLHEKIVEWSQLLPPTAHYYGEENADKAVRSALQIGHKYSVILNLLVRFAVTESSLYLFKYLVGLGYAIRMDVEGLDPDGKLSKYLGVQAAWDNTHDRAKELPQRVPVTPTTGIRGSGTGPVQYEPPFRFVPVSTAWESHAYVPGPATGAYSYGPLG